LRVLVRKEENALFIKALEGEHEGRVIARVEKVLLTDTAVTADGTTGVVKAVWGAELVDDLDNRTILGLSIGRPFINKHRGVILAA
jgi:hypothetical protein